MRPLITPLTVVLNAEKVYALPTIKDVDGDPFKVIVLYAGDVILPDFMTFDYVKNALKIAPTDEKSVGTYNLQFKITDSHSLKGGGSKSRIYDFTVIVEKFNFESLHKMKDKLKQRQKIQYASVEVTGISD